MPLSPGIQIVGRFEIVAPLGAGSMGEVYQAHDLKLRRDVALKLLSPALATSEEHLLRFEREARAASALNHPHICTIYDVGQAPEADGRPYLVMELLRGITLYDAMAAGPLSVPTVIGLGVQIADALDAAHGAGIIHRDLKPANIFVTARGDAKLLDFGLAAVIAGAADASSAGSDAGSPLTSFGTAVGTVLYMSPEQALGDPLDPRTDIFSLGLVLYEMLTGPPRVRGPIDDGDRRRHPALVAAGPRRRRRLGRAEGAPQADRADARQGSGEAAGDRRRDRRAAARRPERIDGGARVRRDLGAQRIRFDAAQSHFWRVSPHPTVHAGTGLVLRPGQGAGARQHPRRGHRRDSVPAARRRRLRRVFVVSRRAAASAPREPLLLADFSNTTGEAVFDGALKDALEIQLQQSPYLKVVPTSQVRSALQLMERSPNEPLTAAVARDLCERLGVKAILLGSIAPLSSAYVITLEAQACRTGDTLARDQAQAASKTDVLATVGTGAARIRERLGESIGSIQRFNVPAPNATTPSLEALKAYSMGIETRVKTGEVQAIPFFEHALELDPNFALAAARLGAIYTNLRELEQAQNYIKRAFARSESLSEPERLFIKSQYHYIVTGRLDDVVATYKLWIATYPDDWVPYNNLSTAYQRMGQFDDALREARSAVRLGPNSVVAYQQMTRALLGLNRMAEASDVIRDSVSKGLESSSLHALAFDLAFIAKDAGGMQEHLRAATPRADGYLVVTEAARAALATGDLAASRRLYAQAIAAARAARITDYAGGLMAEQALGDALLLDVDRARGGVQAAIGVGKGPETTWTASMAAAFAGRPAQAAELAAAFQSRATPAPDATAIQTPLLEAAIALNNNDGRRALGSLSSAVPLESAAGPWLPYMNGLACAASKDYVQAVQQFRNLIARPGDQPTSLLRTLARLQLGRALRDSGDPVAAREAYADFTNTWRNADPKQPLMATAAAEAAALPPPSSSAATPR